MHIAIFIAVLSTIAKLCKTTQISSGRLMYNVAVYMQSWVAPRKKWKLAFCCNWDGIKDYLVELNISEGGPILDSLL